MNKLFLAIPTPVYAAAIAGFVLVSKYGASGFEIVLVLGVIAIPLFVLFGAASGISGRD